MITKARAGLAGLVAVLLALLLIHHPGEPGGEKTAVSFTSMIEGLAFVRSKTILWSSMLLDFLVGSLQKAVTYTE